ncbi:MULTISPECIES: ATP-dependent protease LonB [Caloramator]|jgi:Lon-like ATP-dependent protease|uniref:endopeptidase La n=1 Tax=Caloramator australicus RC3 TaxID=857293 RepID=I7KV73_9CLOT|nr:MULTISPECIES: ATP-dependent protease LonB [Caloramator]MDO6355181.1 ATP-dependent protease LonB [Caloramator sp. CAR-1]CCJ33884.1 ATP-dependent protease La LonB Type I \
MIASQFLVILNLIFTAIIAIYFYNLLKGQQSTKVYIEKESKKELEKLNKLRSISLTEPLSEKTRPSSFDEIIGQEMGIKALKAALCGPNPQHVIIYGPPGVGKTAAARLVLEEAKKNPISPFKSNAKFIEVDAATVRFDDRGIADPLIGSVHDPIYQGAGPLGVAGIPQPKPGAVTKAHGGILFLDEIGELHPIQMNKLLKVLEDRKVFLDSVYYSSEDPNIPTHIKDIFENGLPADFRLVGATTRSPEEIPPAIRSRCVEIFFRALTPDEIEIIARNAAKKGGFTIDEDAVSTVAKYATNGREAVNIVQIAGGIAINEKRWNITVNDVEYVIESGHYSPRPDKKITKEPQVGCVNGLAVVGANLGVLLEVEATAIKVEKGSGKLTITGIIDEEETGTFGRKLRRKSTSKGSVENVLTVLRQYLDIDTRDYDIHVNFPGGMPIDGPSAGVTITTAIYSAITEIPVDNEVAMTGEVSIRGFVKPVGGILAKIEAARKAGAKKVLIPKENYQENFKEMDIEIIPVERIEEVLCEALVDKRTLLKKSTA